MSSLARQLTNLLSAFFTTSGCEFVHVAAHELLLQPKYQQLDVIASGSGMNFAPSLIVVRKIVGRKNTARPAALRGHATQGFAAQDAPQTATERGVQKMRFTRKWIGLLAAGAMAFGLSTSASLASVFHLGFSLDASGSVGSTNYTTMKNGLADALAALPLDGTIEISVTRFSDTFGTVVSPTVLTADTLAGIQAAIRNHNYTGGLTFTGDALRQITDLMNTSTAGSQYQLINMLTDGVPCCQFNANQLAADGAQYAFDQGIDALSIEAIGGGVTSDSALALMASLAFPGPATILDVNQTVGIPNPLGGSWVIPVSDFDALAAVLEAKVIASVTPPPTGVPEPGALLLLSAGLFGVGLARRRRCA